MKANKRIRDQRRKSRSLLRTIVLCRDGVNRNSTAFFSLSKNDLNGSGGRGKLVRISR